MSASPGLSLKSSVFRKEREQSWVALEYLLDLMQTSGIMALSPEQLQEFPLLYRSTLSSLSVARAIALDRALIDYLDHLSLRAYLTLYTPPQDLGRAARSFITDSLPRAVRALRWHAVIALALFALGVWSSFMLCSSSESWFSAFVPAGLASGRGPASSTVELQAVLHEPVGASVLAAIAGVLFAHNTLVALLTFGLGFLAGIPTVFLTFYQGAVVGAFFELYYRRGLTTDFIGWIGIHGVTEIAAFILIAAAGLRLGEILVFPKDTTRVDSFSRYGMQAATVAIGAVVMLIIAAILEGYFRQAIGGTDTRLLVAVGSLVAWSAYYTFCGRPVRR